MNAQRHPQIVLSLVKLLNVSSYLELGLYVGETFELVCSVIRDCVGVDVVDRRRNKSIGTFYNTTTDKFFETNNRTFDLIFIDADHRYESVLRDLKNALKILNQNGTIILHDTDPENISYYNPGFCGDSYKVINELDKMGLDSITIPSGHEGITLVKRKQDRRVLSNE